MASSKPIDLANVFIGVAANPDLHHLCVIRAQEKGSQGEEMYMLAQNLPTGHVRTKPMDAETVMKELLRFVDGKLRLDSEVVDYPPSERYN